MKFDDCIYKEITWFNADEIVEHETFDGIDSYELLRNLATLEAGYSLDDKLDDEAVERVAMVNRLELAGVGCRSRLIRTSLKRLVELTDEFCC